MTDSTFHAVLIGVDYYFPNKLSNGGEYRSLSGCVNDVERVEAMLTLRLKGLEETRRLRIQKLVAPNVDGKPGGEESSWPTAANIRMALAQVADRARPGDQVYIHYAGHGGRVSTRWPELKGDEGVDEALVPMDIGRTSLPNDPRCTFAERYIRDVELAFYLDQLAGKQGETAENRVVTTLIFDSCHSGGATRGTEISARCATGGNGTLDRPAAANERVFTDKDMNEMAEALRRLRSSPGTRAATSGGTPWLPPARGYVLLAACRDVETALEVAVDETPRAGVLTSAYLEALATLGDEQSWKTVYDRVLARVAARFPSQTPSWSAISSARCSEYSSCPSSSRYR